MDSDLRLGQGLITKDTNIVAKMLFSISAESRMVLLSGFKLYTVIRNVTRTNPSSFRLKGLYTNQFNLNMLENLRI